MEEFTKALKIISEYSQLDGVSRHEEKVATKFKENLQDANLTYFRDGLGSVIVHFKKQNQGPRIQIAAHMDEVGFMVMDILENGQLRLAMIGGIWVNTVVGTKGILHTASGKKLEGLFGHTAIHILEAEKRLKAVPLEDLYFDLGFNNREEVEKAGVEAGNVISLIGKDFQMGNKSLFAAKAIDNRAGLTALTLLAQRLSAQEDKLRCNPYFVGTVQEEVGTRGARSSVQLVEPQIAIALDTVTAHDTYKTIPGRQKLGDGVAIRMQDRGAMADPKFVAYLQEIAQKHQIKMYQFVAQGGVTDASQLQFGKGGVATVTFAIPQRYNHCPYGVVSLEDILSAVDLMEKFILDLDLKKYQKFIQYK